MIPIRPDHIRELLVTNSDEVLAKASQKYVVNGFAFVFEVGQPEPCFFFASNTSSNRAANPATGEWDFPAGGFEGGSMSENWRDCFGKLDAYMTEDEESEDRLREVHAVLCSAMKTTRERWLARLGGCLFTVNECNDSDQVVREVYEDINAVRAS